ncbi:hypothetical protein WJ972_05900 [Achromobacter insuavis]
MLASADMIDILAQSLDGAPVAPIEQATGIALNRALLRAWRAGDPS